MVWWYNLNTKQGDVVMTELDMLCRVEVYIDKLANTFACGNNWREHLLREGNATFAQVNFAVCWRLYCR